jgi:hypothetical protein
MKAFDPWSELESVAPLQAGSGTIYDFAERTLEATLAVGEGRSQDELRELARCAGERIRLRLEREWKWRGLLPE